MKEIIQTASVISVLLFFWQYDRDNYSPHSKYNLIFFVLALVLNLSFVILEIREKKSDKKPWTLWLSLIILPVLILLLLQEMIINQYSIIIMLLFVILALIPLVKKIIQKDE